jgi:methionyl-tRNA formyltransferase
MKVTLLTGSHPRHLFVAQSLYQAGLLAALIIEEREAFVPSPPPNLDPELNELFIHHFREREKAESDFFSEPVYDFNSTAILKVQKDELNSAKVWDFIKANPTDIAFSYGVHILLDDTLKHFSGQAWNIHGGLSPWYRGTATMFWPSYMLEPQMTGMTVHQLVRKIDAGDIIHQTTAPLVRGDGVHQLACRAVIALAEELPQLVEIYGAGGLKPPERQKSSGKLWLNKDWRPEHLIPVYKHFENRIVDMYLDGRIRHFEPDIVRQF